VSDGGVKNGAGVGTCGRTGADNFVVVDRGAGFVEVEAVPGLLFVVLLLAVVLECDLVE
jgi:hypothetical protein